MSQKKSKIAFKKDSYITPEKKSKMLIPYAVLCELTHRCPLSCPYCSNPLQLEMKSNEVSTEVWKKALSEAVKLGILQAHFLVENLQQEKT